MQAKPLVWLKTEVKTPPFSSEARQEVGRLLRDLQEGEKLSMPDSRPMPSIGKRCHELRVWDSETKNYWRVVYRLDSDAVIVIEVFAKKTQTTPLQVINTCKKRIRDYDF